MFVFFIVFALYVFVLFGCCFCLAYVYLKKYIYYFIGGGGGGVFPSLLGCIMLFGTFVFFIVFVLHTESGQLHFVAWYFSSLH